MYIFIKIPIIVLGNGYYVRSTDKIYTLSLI